MPDLSVAGKVAPVKTEPPLCVDLDGTLVKSDTLYDSLAVLARRQPSQLLRAPLWLLRGKAYFKAQVCSRVQLDVKLLPYNLPLLDFLRAEHAAGRRLYLATGADASLANRVAAHHGIFAGVLASDGSTNLTGNKKLDGLEGRFAGEGFDYVGNALPDIPLLMHARQAMIANPALGLKRALKAGKVEVRRSFLDRSNTLTALMKAIRIHQWAKNVLVFLPLLLAHSFQLPMILPTLATFFCFCFTASATYIVNDLLDLEADRVHPSKRKRAFAAGELSPATGLAVSLLLLATAFTTASVLPPGVFIYLLLYLVTTLAYSLALKRMVLIDVLALSALYTIRMLAGASATRTLISPWLAAFSIFLFLSLAMVKRLSELQNLRDRGAVPANGRGYLLNDIEQLRSFGTASAYASIVVFALYISGNEVARLYHHPTRMWLITPLMIFWLSRIWLLASRGVLDEDPVVFALTDTVSLLVGLGVVVVALIAL